MKKNNKRIKSILQVGVITILSFAAAFPVLRNINGHDLRLNGKESSTIYAYNAANLADIVSASSSDAGKSTAEVKPYMSYIPDVYDPDLNFKDIEKHLTDASPDEFSDPYIIEDAKFYSEQGYKLINSEYAVKYYGQGIGIGDYAFTNGFSRRHLLRIRCSQGNAG